MTELTYREAKLHDARTITEFQIAMARETEELDLDRRIVSRGVEAVFEDRSLGRYFVAEDEDRLAGALLITFEWSDWRNGLVWWIQSVYIHPDYRRRGVYAGLYALVKRLAEAHEMVKGIRLYVDKRNVAAQEVYKRLGMTGEHYQTFEWMKG
jgi:GNAT superfamily N-acetyltransferase